MLLIIAGAVNLYNTFEWQHLSAETTSISCLLHFICLSHINQFLKWYGFSGRQAGMLALQEGPVWVAQTSEDASFSHCTLPAIGVLVMFCKQTSKFQS
jgi:hypothetical protein